MRNFQLSINRPHTYTTERLRLYPPLPKLTTNTQSKPSDMRMFSPDELISALNGIDLVLGIGEVKNTHPLSLLQRPHPDVAYRCSMGYTLQGNAV